MAGAVAAFRKPANGGGIQSGNPSGLGKRACRILASLRVRAVLRGVAEGRWIQLFEGISDPAGREGTEAGKFFKDAEAGFDVFAAAICLIQPFGRLAVLLPSFHRLYPAKLPQDAHGDSKPDSRTPREFRLVRLF